jgi:hypothetical protein
MQTLQAFLNMATGNPDVQLLSKYTCHHAFDRPATENADILRRYI